MERKRVNSNRIRAVGYDPKTRELEVEFRDGQVSGYAGVSPEIYRQFMAAPSPTSFFEDKVEADYTPRRVQ